MLTGIHAYVKEWAASLRETGRWRNVHPQSGTPAVSYGYRSLPSRSDKVSGGIIKLQDLSAAFPNENEQPNILYLISSALPAAAACMARLAQKRGVKFVLNQNGVAYPGWHGPGWEKTNRPLAAVLQQSDYVIYQSEFCKLSTDRYLGACRGPSQVLHNPVDTAVFRPVDARIDRPWTILVAGSHLAFYRIQSAVDALQALAGTNDNVRLLFAGQYGWRRTAEESLAELRQYVHHRQLTERVEIRETYTQDESVALLQSADLLMHTKYNDPCPRVVVEAMACGLPVVYSATGGVPELVGTTAGLGVPGPLDWEKDHAPHPEELAQAVLQILADYPAYTNAARARAVACFDVRLWLDQHREIFTQLLGAND